MRLIINKILYIILFSLLTACANDSSKSESNSINGASVSKNNLSDSLLNNKNGKWGEIKLDIGEDISTLCIYNNKVYVGGTALITNKNRIDEIISLDNMQQLDGGIKDTESIVNAMTVYNNSLVIGGFFDTVGGKSARGMAKWNDDKLEPFDNIIIKGKKYLEPMALTVYNSELIAAGRFDSINGTLLNDIAKWDGSKWKSLAGGLKGSAHSLGVLTLLINHNDLYVGGSFSFADGQPASNIAKWDGKNWSSLNGGIGIEGNNVIYSLAFYKGELYAGGIINSIKGKLVNNIIKWNGNSWEELGNGVSDKKRDENAPAIGVYALIEYNGELYVGGSFGFAGGKPAANIAKWDGKNWSSVGESNKLEGETIKSMCVFNDELYIGGSARPDPGSAFIIKWTELSKK